MTSSPERTRAWRLANPERKKLGDARWYSENREYANARSASYYAANKATCLANMKLWREKNATQVSKRRRLQRVAKGDHIRARRRQHYTDNKAAYIANACKREADKLRATPAWADYKLMLTFYERAEEMTRTTGIEHHVDHIVPLRSRRVCGLHSHHNLQVLTAEQNLRKGNRLSGD